LSNDITQLTTKKKQWTEGEAGELTVSGGKIGLGLGTARSWFCSNDQRLEGGEVRTAAGELGATGGWKFR